MSKLSVINLSVTEQGEREGERVTESANELYTELYKYLPPGSLPKGEVSDDKGDPITLLSIAVALVSSGAVTEMVKCVRDWIARRPRHRSLVVRDDSGKDIINITADNVDDASVVEAIKAAAAMATN